ncbi:hypothetical protein [Candidatus Poriferisodalis sp.]|uniref:hypothetical protein n=1 Tax=Candidatus Poriferisodalis sp. TaxID=3101277 RepID=UPI003C6EBA21
MSRAKLPASSLGALRETDRVERKEDLRSVKVHHYTVIGFIVALFVGNLTIL